MQQGHAAYGSIAIQAMMTPWPSYWQVQEQEPVHMQPWFIKSSMTGLNQQTGKSSCPVCIVHRSQPPHPPSGYQHSGWQPDAGEGDSQRA